MAYNTGNAIGSADARDLLDNAVALDHAINSTDQKFFTRLGAERMTLAGMAEAASGIPAVEASIAATEAAARVESVAQHYLGAHASAPTVRASGAALQAGDHYFDTAIERMHVYDGSAWSPITPASRTLQSYRGTGAQTSFSLGAAGLSGTVADVFIGGLRQSEASYHVSAGALVFAEAPPLPDADVDNIDVVIMQPWVIGVMRADAVAVEDADAALGGATTAETALKTLATRLLARPTLGDVIDRARAGQQITIACYGTSLTYGQDEVSATHSLPINGASQTRSILPWPEQLQQALSWAGFPVAPQVINRGFPGDRTTEGLTRWAGASATDVAIIEYGTNDALNFGGYPSGPVAVAQYRANLIKLIDRAVSSGAVPILLGPPPVNEPAMNARLRAYAAAARDIAARYGIEYVEMAELLLNINGKWTDNVHLVPRAYNQVGWMLAALFYGRDGAMRHVSAGDMFYATDFLGFGGVHQGGVSGEKSGTGYVIKLAPGRAYAVGVYCEDPCYPLIHSYNAGASATIINAYFAGCIYDDLAGLTHDPTKGVHQSFLGNPLQRGIRTFLIRNDGLVDACIEAIEFVSYARASYSRGMQYSLTGLAGAFSAAADLAAAASWHSAVDYGTQIAAPCAFTTRVVLAGSGSSGLILAETLPAALAVEIMSGNSLLVLRNGTSLVLRELRAGAVAGETVVSSVFAAGEISCEIELRLAAGVLTAYVDGVLKATLESIDQTTAYPGLICSADGGYLCHGASVRGNVKVN